MLTRSLIMQVTHFNNAKLLAEVSENIGEAMVGLNMYVIFSLLPGIPQKH